MVYISIYLYIDVKPMYLSIFRYTHHGRIQNLRRGGRGSSASDIFLCYSQNIDCFDQEIKTRFLKLNFRQQFFLQFKIWSEFVTSL